MNRTRSNLCSARPWMMIALLPLAGCVFDEGYAEPRHREVYVVEAPPEPAPVTEVVTVSPGPEFVWVAGYHEYVGDRYTWVGGHWARPPHAHSSWRAGHWERHGRGQVWVSGGWR